MSGPALPTTPLKGAGYALTLVALTQAMSLLDRQILAILAPGIKADLAIGDAEMGLLYGTVFALFYAVFVRPAIEVDVVGGFSFALHACAHELQFPFDERLFVWRHAGVGKQGGEFGKVDALGVGFFQDHGQGLF